MRIKYGEEIIDVSVIKTPTNWDKRKMEEIILAIARHPLWQKHLGIYDKLIKEYNKL